MTRRKLASEWENEAVAAARRGDWLNAAALYTAAADAAFSVRRVTWFMRRAEQCREAAALKNARK